LEKQWEYLLAKNLDAQKDSWMVEKMAVLKVVAMEF